MKKSLTAIAIAAVIGAPMVAQADEGPTLFGQVHMSVEKAGKDSLIMSGAESKANQLGVRGNVDTNLMGMKAVYQAGVGFDTQTGTNATGGFYLRDTWVGLSSKELGTARGGMLDIHYKDSGKPIDPFFATALEGRQTGTGTRGGKAHFVGQRTMSPIHARSNDDGGRQNHTVRYDSPSLSGVKVSANYGLVDDGENNFGIGAEYSEGNIYAFVDHVSFGNVAGHAERTGTNVDDGTATKLGGKYTMGDMSFSAQYEIDGGAISGMKDGEQNMLFVAATYTMGATTFGVSGGMADDTGGKATNSANCAKGTYSTATTAMTCKDGNTSFAIGVKHALAKKTTIYGGVSMAMNGDDANLGNNTDANGDTSTTIAVGMMSAF